ncbi:hypothetical protein [Roseateles toxinivorans]|uniref:STAS domain-containing protein n=1 Tax=Roseateles toxinivorans TaxID=270368 RepID=A0A4R6QRC5_9BURK|nr:hypothetical protein [Roseateles toxinivorans]TDP73313.1 hypothetical protein DES47_1021075 [Roseateles toxinivorans]
MTDPKDGESFFRKVVRFVANPATDWAELSTKQDSNLEDDLAKSELKSMIERKRRNDFVRKNELDMLRRVRREGLTNEQLAALGSASSRMEDSGRHSEPASGRPEKGVKAKIDAIEQQMVSENVIGGNRPRPPSFYDTATQPAHFSPPQPPSTPEHPGGPPAMARPANTRPGRLEREPSPSVADAASAEELERLELTPPPAAATMKQSMPPLSEANKPAEISLVALDFLNDRTVLPEIEVSEVVHDPELDEAVIAFANADFEQCERALLNMTLPGGPRNLQSETWLVLFDLYRATGQQDKFEALALNYAQQFALSSPQWFSLPKLVAAAASAEPPKPSQDRGDIGWVSPEVLDLEAVSKLRSQTLQMPLPWVFDWGPLRQVEVEACGRLSELMRQWAVQPLDLRWLSGEHFFNVLKEASPTGVRDADPAYWMLRLDALRVANRPDQFDETAIDYCVTYEVSPPSWERVTCRARISGATQSTVAPPTSIVTEASTSFMESQILDQAGMVQVAQFELSGQLVGDISDTLKRMNAELGNSTQVNVSCTRLIRVDFIAAGDLLNWVLSRRGENRAVTFTEAHRLVALFFGAMGINEHAKVKVHAV